MYSGTRHSTFEVYRKYLARESTTANPFDDDNAAESGATPTTTSVKPENNRANSFLAPTSQTGQSQGSDPRLSEFYEAYYRNSHIGPAQSNDTRNQAVDRQSTIMEVESPPRSPTAAK